LLLSTRINTHEQGVLTPELKRNVLLDYRLTLPLSKSGTNNVTFVGLAVCAVGK